MLCAVSSATVVPLSEAVEALGVLITKDCIRMKFKQFHFEMSRSGCEALVSMAKLTVESKNGIFCKFLGYLCDFLPI
jgi:hypothetical protein